MTKRRRTRGTQPGFLARAFLAAVVASAAWLAVKVLTWPNVAALARTNPKSTAFIEKYESERRRDDEKPPLRWAWTPWERISSNLKRAVVVAEDAEFFAHDGFSEREIKAAIEKAVERRELPRGASTITQQLAKNLWLSPSRSPLRKAEEALLTRQLEEQLTKKRILELYLNVAEFGPGIYGAEAASRAYFKKSASALSVREAAALAASLPKPSSWHPGSRSRYYNRRTGRIEAMAMRAGFLGRYLGGSTSEEVQVASRDRKETRSSRDTSDRAERAASEREMNRGPVPEPSVTPTSVSTKTEAPPGAPDASAPRDPTAHEPAREPPIAEADSGATLEEMMRELREEMDRMNEEENALRLEESEAPE